MTQDCEAGGCPLLELEFRSTPSTFAFRCRACGKQSGSWSAQAQVNEGLRNEIESIWKELGGRPVPPPAKRPVQRIAGECTHYLAWLKIESTTPTVFHVRCQGCKAAWPGWQGQQLLNEIYRRELVEIKEALRVR